MAADRSLLRTLRRGGRLHVRRGDGYAEAWLVDADGRRSGDLSPLVALDLVRADGVRVDRRDGPVTVYVAEPEVAPAWSPEAEAAWRDRFGRFEDADVEEAPPPPDRPRRRPAVDADPDAFPVVLPPPGGGCGRRFVR